MNIRVRLFAAAREWIDRSELELELPEGATVGQLRAAIVAGWPQLAPLRGHLLIAVAQQYASDDVMLTPEAETALIPPVSGG